ncbi:D-ribose pyranase [Paenibacillus sp. PK4536]|uniref:D-ribose pyranase n=1 Tax=Paenibacillus nuruki TaxID=1886670 RepID=A0A1E3L266_9BACL|nr:MULTISPECIES: D-ribose pyranase [Paenibacillus]ODP27889.1 D-ribose pyranase [Paenibacillus nuruki]WIM38456.1 D-ribose pyranase [Paenibacillus sp. PK4536]
MKKNGILNSHISKVLADLGHTDYIVIADVGLPVPDGVPKIDLALTYGVPSFRDVVHVISEDMAIEQITIAEEMVAQNQDTFLYMQQKFDHIPLLKCSHEEFKRYSQQAKVIIRTGESRPYANCILHAGVHFGTAAR